MMPSEVALPAGVPGKLYIYRMPGHIGYDRSFEEDSELIAEVGIDSVVCLAPLDEIGRKSPAYARAIASGSVPWARRDYPIEDFTAPEGEERPAFLSLVQEIAADLRAGKRVMIHCAAGKGRSGTVATAVLLALGASRDDALQRVRDAGGRPETESQFGLIDWIGASV